MASPYTRRSNRTPEWISLFAVSAIAAGFMVGLLRMIWTQRWPGFVD
jgi:hypothetical protein